jgi:hypothetical protein
MSRFAIARAAGLTLAFTVGAAISTPAQAQNGMYRQGNCVYQTNGYQSAILGCYFAAGGRTWYVDAASTAARDEATGIWFKADANRTSYIYTTQGWQLAENHPAGRQVLDEIRSYGRGGMRVRISPGSVGSWSMADMAKAFGDQNAASVFNQVTESNRRMTDTWTRPACTGSTNGC